mmetsp:Transcript_70698/g.199569  ORF Transcript_70698/g.199569 Transcript_70698/m.199569 type:complete len:219 (-) Transcript_70698:1131-1787(-)
MLWKRQFPSPGCLTTFAPAGARGRFGSEEGALLPAPAAAPALPLLAPVEAALLVSGLLKARCAAWMWLAQAFCANACTNSSSSAEARLPGLNALSTSIASGAVIFGCPGFALTGPSRPWATAKHASATPLWPKPSAQCSRHPSPPTSALATSETTDSKCPSGLSRADTMTVASTRLDKPKASSAGACRASGVAAAAKAPHRSHENADGHGKACQKLCC